MNMNRGPFEQFTAELQAIAQTWPEHHEAVQETQFQSVFESMASTALKEVAAARPQLPDMLTNHNAQHGANVIARYLQFSALAAKRDGIQLRSLEDVMQDDRSFAPLSAIATKQNKLAHRTENDYGLGSHATSSDTYVLDRYQIRDGAMTLTDIDTTIAIHAYQLSSEGKEMYAAECAAHRSKSLKKIYHSFVTICARDEALFPLTLAD